MAASHLFKRPLTNIEFSLTLIEGKAMGIIRPAGAFLGFCILALGCGPTQAADFPATAPLPPQESWTGFHLGLGGGLSSLNDKLDAERGSDPSSPFSASLNGLGASGLLATINAGYDYQFSPSFVVGAFGDLDIHSLRSSLDVDIPSAPLTIHGEFSVRRQWSIGGRIGYLTSPNTLVFLSVGYTDLSVSNFAANISPGNQIATVAAVAPHIAGGFVGAGFETKLTNAVSLMGEYRFSEFGSGLVRLPTINGTDINQFVTARISPTLQIAKATVNYRF
jgi:outer membrane immunogenic protein